jgi:hypothetical protein
MQQRLRQLVTLSLMISFDYPSCSRRRERISMKSANEAALFYSPATRRMAARTSGDRSAHLLTSRHSSASFRTDSGQPDGQSAKPPSAPDAFCACFVVVCWLSPVSALRFLSPQRLPIPPRGLGNSRRFEIAIVPCCRGPFHAGRRLSRHRPANKTVEPAQSNQPFLGTATQAQHVRTKPKCPRPTVVR